jgi:hypothetical protein
MRNRCTGILAAGGGAVLAAALGVPTAVAAATAKTWTVQPGGAITASSGQFTAADTTTGTVLQCRSSSASGTLKSGSGLPGADAGSLSAVGVTSCGGPGSDFRVQAGGLPWHVNLSSYNAATGVARGTIGHIRITGSGQGCTFVIDGTSGTAGDGRVVFRYTDGTGRLKLLTTGGNLHWYDVSTGCLGLVNSGDPATFSVAYTMTPEQAITSP